MDTLEKAGIKLVTNTDTKTKKSKFTYPLNELLEDIAALPKDGRIDHMMKVIGKNYVKLNFTDTLVLFTPMAPAARGKSVQFSYKYAECSGVIIDYDNCQLMSVAPSPITSTTFGKLDDKWDYLNLHHGTQLTAYWYDNEWCLQSTNSVDIKDKEYRGIKFIDAFNECLEASDMLLSALDKELCHTFCIRHAKLHPLKEDNMTKATLLVSVNLGKIKCSKSLYKLRNACDNINEMLVPFKSDDAKITIKNYAEFLQKVKKGSIDTYLKTGDAFYGVIIRSTYQSKAYPGGVAIMIESDLQAALRKMVYNVRVSNRQAETVSTIDPSLIIDINNWVFSYVKHGISSQSSLESYSPIYIKLFPEKKEAFKSFEQAFTNMVNDILANKKESSVQEIRVALLKKNPDIFDSDHARLNVTDLIRSPDFIEHIICYIATFEHIKG